MKKDDQWVKRTFSRPCWESGNWYFWIQYSEVHGWENVSGQSYLSFRSKAINSSIMRGNHRLHNGQGSLLVWRGDLRRLVILCWDVCDMCLFPDFFISTILETHFKNCRYAKLANIDQRAKQPFLPVPNAYFAEPSHLGSRVYTEQSSNTCQVLLCPRGE